jgi:PEP-CTERM motif-containing protein
MLKLRHIAAGMFAGTALLVMAGIGQAATLTTGDIQVNVGGGTTEVKIFFDAADNVTTASGHVGSQTGLAGTPIVTFTTNIAADFANGYATITPHTHGTEITSVTFSVPTGWFFTDTLFSTLNSDTIKIQAYNGGTSGTLVGEYTNDSVANGLSDWLTVAINGSLMDTIVISTFGANDGFQQLKQFNISGLVFCSPTGSGCAPPPGLVPLPGALPLFVAGAGLLGFVGWRRKKRMA